MIIKIKKILRVKNMSRIIKMIIKEFVILK
jgi:hypothetical protein